MPKLAYSYQNVSKGPPGLTSPSDKRIDINNTCDFTTYVLQKYLRINPGTFGREMWN